MSETSGNVVLIVDDDPQLEQVLAALLGAEKIQTLVSRSAPEALRILESGRQVDAVITDLQMPDMDGMQFLSAVVGRWPDIPVLMLTGFGTIPIAVEAMKKGAADFMLKPFQNAEVVYCVKKALARSDQLQNEPIRTPMPE